MTRDSVRSGRATSIHVDIPWSASGGMPHPDALARLVANEEEQAELSRRQSELSRRLSELATEHAELAQLAALATPPALSNFPTGLLQHILLWATDHDDLLRHASVCACVCSDWHRIVLSSSAYGFGWAVGARTRHHVEERRAERGRVLQVISNALWVARALSTDESRKLHLADERISDNGGRALGKALQAWSCPLALTSIDLSSNGQLYSTTVCGTCDDGGGKRRAQIASSCPLKDFDRTPYTPVSSALGLFARQNPLWVDPFSPSSISPRVLGLLYA
eukprot:COSAG02_NODE_322_length_24779_cov_14.118233_3_plen_279_part_00